MLKEGIRLEAVVEKCLKSSEVRPRFDLKTVNVTCEVHPRFDLKPVNVSY